MPSMIGANRIDKAYIGAQEVTAVYLGAERVYPNTTRWERWSLKWPLATGVESNYSYTTSNQKLNWDGTLQAQKSNLYGIQEGDVARIYTVYRYCLSVSVDKMQRLMKAYSPNVAPTPLRDAYIDTVEHIDDNAYPENGRQGDYWYTKI